MEDQADYLQQLKERSGLDPEDPRDRLLAELTDTVSMLCHQVYRMGAVNDGLSETLEEIQSLLEFEYGVDEDGDGDEMGVDEYFDGSETPLYEIKCPRCGDRFAVDEQTLQRGFACPNCGENLIQAE